MQLTSKKIYPVVAPTPAIPVDFVKPLSYEFRVAEHVDDSGKITKVCLQVQVWEHDEFGSGTVKYTWTDVPRYKFDKSGQMLIK